MAQLAGVDYIVKSVATREKKRNPVAPFITSTLQQESARKLRFSVKRTMMLAQRLYEGIEIGKEGAVGLITYMRTDSTRISDDAIAEVRQYIAERYGANFLPASPNIYKSKKDAQDAHEAIRPTSMAYSPEVVEPYLPEDEMKVYRLIWNRFVATQMMPALFDQTTIDVSARGKNGVDYTFRATGSVPKFDGFLKVYQEGKDQVDEDDEELKHRLPAVSEGEVLRFQAIKPEQHFTEPPPRYNEATLVKRLEADGVGRPSTYATILSTIQEREYVKKESGRFTPTELGMVVTDLLLESFDDIFDVKYTARMEEELDEIEEGKLDWRVAMDEFYDALRQGPEARRNAHDRYQADGEAHRLDLRKVRQAPGDQVGQARQFHRLHRLSRLLLQEHRKPIWRRCRRISKSAGKRALKNIEIKRAKLQAKYPQVTIAWGEDGEFIVTPGSPRIKTLETALRKAGKGNRRETAGRSRQDRTAPGEAAGAVSPDEGVLRAGPAGHRRGRRSDGAEKRRVLHLYA